MDPKYIESFLCEYSEFSINPIINNEFILKGELQRVITYKENEPLKLFYSLSIHFSADYPSEPPIIYENKNQIQKVSSNHINPDGSFCLGSPIRLKLVLKKTPDFKYFFESCVLPYLYAVTMNQQHGKGFIFGELDHGNEGLISDFQDLFHLEKPTQVFYMLKVLSTRKKIANKMNCPCECGKRVTKCNYFNYVVRMRKTFTRSEWEEQYNIIGGI